MSESDVPAAVEERRVRPTLRCLTVDLIADVGPKEVRVALRQDEDLLQGDPTYLLPVALGEIEHALLTKANELASGDGSRLERIQTITDRHVFKVKTGPLRGAMWKDADGQWWLLAAGRRKADGGGDFYVELERLEGDSSPLGPSARDAEYGLLEAAYRVECERERAAHKDVVGALLRAARDLSVAQGFEIFGAAASVRFVPDDAGVTVLEVSWDLHSFEEQDRFPADVLAMVPGSDDIEEWDYLPGPPGEEADALWYKYVPRRWVDDLAVAAELDLIDPSDEWVPSEPVTNGSELHSHWAKGSAVTRAYVEGIEIQGLCGAKVVAHRDYADFPICQACREAAELLRSMRT